MGMIEIVFRLFLLYSILPITYLPFRIFFIEKPPNFNNKEKP